MGLKLKFFILYLYLFSSAAMAGGDNLILAQSLIEKFNYPDAVNLLQKEILDPSHGKKAAALLLDSLYKMGNFKEVQSTALKYLSAHPLHFEARLKLVESSIALGQYDKALDESATLVRIYAQQEKAVCLRAQLLQEKFNKTSTAIYLLQKFLSQKSNNTNGDARMLLANMYFQSSAYKKAYDEALKIKELGPITDKLYILIGKIQSHLHQYENAIENLKFAKKLAPQNADAYIELAKLYVTTGKTQEAMNLLSGAMEQVPESQRDFLFIEMGRAQISLGHYVAAREALNSIGTTSPYLERAQYLITQSYLKQNDYSSAEESLTKFLKQNKGRNWAILAMARIFELTANKADVENWIKKNIELSENSNELDAYLNKKTFKPSKRLLASTVKSEIVRDGDNLHAISMRVYGHTGMWRNIYRWNKDVIEDPNILIEGTKLRICGDEKCE